MKNSVTENSIFNRSRQPIHRLAAALGLFLLGTVLVTGCAEIRKVTYPDDFIYLEPKQVSGKMALMGLYMRQLDEILLDNSTISSEQQARIVSLLSSIDANADSLGAGNVITNHLLIDTHIDQFKSDVTLALRDASANPPNYFALGKLSGSCNACHKYRKY